MDHFEVTIANNRISVNTAKAVKGTTENAKFAVKG